MFSAAASNQYARLPSIISRQFDNAEKSSNSWIAIYDYAAAFDDELSLKFGQSIEIVSRDSAISGDDGWWVGKCGNKIGVFPRNYIAPLTKQLIQFLQSNPSYNELNTGAGFNFDNSSKATVQNALFSNLRQIDFNQLSLQEFIGAGGFGKVYHGYFDDQEVAIKAAKINSNEDLSEITNNVLAEARNFSLLDHKNIIGLIGVCLQEPNLCIVLEYAKGGPLNRCLAGRQLPPSVLVNWAQQIAEGMHYLHFEAAIHLVHRDLKSSNGWYIFIYKLFKFALF